MAMAGGSRCNFRFLIRFIDLGYASSALSFPDMRSHIRAIEMMNNSNGSNQPGGEGARARGGGDCRTWKNDETTNKNLWTFECPAHWRADHCTHTIMGHIVVKTWHAAHLVPHKTAQPQNGYLHLPRMRIFACNYAEKNKNQMENKYISREYGLNKNESRRAFDMRVSAANGV